jgi:hypothetical protein
LPAQITNLKYRYTALRTRIGRVSGAAMSPRTESDRRIQKIKLQKENNMEPTITQNSALFFAHRKVSKRHATLFRGLRTASSKQGQDAQRQLTCTALFIARRLHQDNGR